MKKSIGLIGFHIAESIYRSDRSIILVNDANDIPNEPVFKITNNLTSPIESFSKPDMPRRKNNRKRVKRKKARNGIKNH